MLKRAVKVIGILLYKVRSQVRVAERGEWKARVATWNFSGFCSQRKQKEVAGVLETNNVDVCAGQESWEKEESKISVVQMVQQA